MEEYIIKFLFIAKAIKNKNRSVISSYKLSPNEIDLLVALDMGVYDTAKEIADNFEISKSLVCRSVDSLTKKGYIDTQKDEKDKRVSHLILREEAKPIVDALKENRKKTTEDLLLGIDKEELKIFSKVLNQMKNNMI
ncbi:MarR family winged helix-turn-helix transcriptional regulator [Terrisporobacter sp.]|uniref:MarR family winged helix-turn-helix transcriptional regulator n=1 Tax=Terrisporobacter sp. TaxID=1965305 RepID=UPI002A83C437|nr:MarR family winged helix-turn-helix transcriptional regulator [Terrisporobacter sp.]MDY4735731.1 MarR family winged helix-turn-helix transcriptional regulator [Terrisporobacter sp.]